MKYLECVFDLCAEDDDEPVEAGEEEDDDDEPVRHDIVARFNLPIMIEISLKLSLQMQVTFSWHPVSKLHNGQPVGHSVEVSDL